MACFSPVNSPFVPLVFWVNLGVEESVFGLFVGDGVAGWSIKDDGEGEVEGDGFMLLCKRGRDDRVVEWSLACSSRMRMRKSLRT